MIETTITKIQYDADGVQRRWSIPFPYADVKHISIYTKVGEEPTVKVVDNYDIDEDDAVVIYPTVASGQEPLVSGTKITIARETPETQLEDASQVHFTSKDVERGLDKLTMITQELSTTSGETMEVSAAAFEAAEEAVNSAAQANKTAEEAKAIAGQAVGIAEDAKSIASSIDAKATEALTNSNTAVNTANSAKQTAEGIDDKATQALANSTEALTKATEAKNTADSYQGQITTLRNDVDDLGDQVAAIEGKIPAEATTANQLADKEFVTTITDELAADITALDADVQNINLIKWVQALPATGETKYLYAIPRNEVDKEGKKIVALYLWDGTEWRGAGGTSIDPGISEGDGIKGDYCTTYGIIDAPNGILTNPSGMEVVLKQGVVLQLAGQDIKTTISGDMAHTITSTADCDLFYVSGTTSLMEVAEIVWSRIEPDNGQTGVLAWWNPNNKKWKFKSNDTGNVWAEAVATPVAHIHTNGTTITRIDHIGYRVLDDEVYALKSDLSLSKRPLGEVYFSQSSLATDNPGALPGWTGEYYENGKTLFPDLYNFVKAHSELQVTKAQYDSAIATYGECPKYCIKETLVTNTITSYKFDFSGATGINANLYQTAVFGYLDTSDNFVEVATNNIFYFEGNSYSTIHKQKAYIDKELTKEVRIQYRKADGSWRLIKPMWLLGRSENGAPAISRSSNGTSFDAWGTDVRTPIYLTTSYVPETVTTTTSEYVEGTSLRLPKHKNSGRYLVKKEVNGNDWYALYSDGWLEQGGYFANPQTIGTTAITETFWKPYATPPTLLFGNMSTRHQAAYDSEHYPYNVTATGFTHENVQPIGQGTRWYAFGYAAATPMENIKYPWIVSFTAAVPASTAQAAEFTNALTGKANTDLSNVLANIDYVVESKVPTESDPSWYRKYKSGWIEQGGETPTVAGGHTTTVTLLKPYSNTVYNVMVQPIGAYTNSGEANNVIPTRTTTNFVIASGQIATQAFSWRAEGQGA